MLKSIDGSRIVSASADENGNFKVWGESGTYNVEISCFGLEKIIIRQLRLGSGEIRVIHATLGPREK